MAWNPHPDVQVARDAAAALGKLRGSPVRRIAIVYFTDDQMGLATFGQTREMCAEAKAIGEAMYAEARRLLMEPHP